MIAYIQHDSKKKLFIFYYIKQSDRFIGRPIFYSLFADNFERMVTMSIRKDIPLEEFELFISPPESRFGALSVNIYADGRFNLNGKLVEKLTNRNLSIRFTKDGKYLCLVEGGDIAFPKGGSRKLPDMIEKLKGTKISYPARYVVVYSESTKTWQGAYEENPTKPPSEKVRSTRKQSAS